MKFSVYSEVFYKGVVEDEPIHYSQSLGMKYFHRCDML